MAQTLFLKPCISTPSCNWSQQKLFVNHRRSNTKARGRVVIVAMGMLTPRKFMQKRKKEEVFKDAADEVYQKNWRRLMKQIEDNGSAVTVLRSERNKNRALPIRLILGTLVRFKHLKKWNLVGEILEWLQTQHWWNFSEMDFLMLISACGKQGDFNKAEKVLSLMNKKGYPPHVVSHTALMEAYGRRGQYNNAEGIFRRMQSSGPEPSALTYQIMLKIFIEGNKFKEGEDLFDTLLNEKKSPLKPDQKMFNMMIYMHKKAGNYEKARKIFALMSERGVLQSTATYNNLMSFTTDYKEVSNIYDQMQRSGLKPDVISYALLIKAYGKARREEEALAVFEEMRDAGIRPSRKAYNILLDAYAISGMVDHAWIVFKIMRRDSCTPDHCSYTTMLSAYVNASDMDGAEKFLRRMKQDGFEPNVVTYGTLIKGYGKVNNLDMMMGKYEEMRLSGVKANQIIFTTIMDAYGKNKDFDSAVIWYKEMEYHGVPPDRKAKNILLSLAKSEEEKSEANQLVGHLDNGGSARSINGAFRHVDDDEDDDDEEDDDANGNKDDAELTVFSHEQKEDLIVIQEETGPGKEGLHNVAVIGL